MQKKIIVLAGPTASGKTSLSILLAQQLGIPILSADSRQLYKRLDIGTAKPTAAELNLVRHYFINHIDIDQKYTAGIFQKEGTELLEELWIKNDYVILSGGTGLYLQALLEGFDNLEASDEKTRNQVQEYFRNHGLNGLQIWLQKLDPVYYQQIDQNNPRRLSRGIEFNLMTGSKLSDFQKKQLKSIEFKIIPLVLLPSRDILYQRINQRVDVMIQNGLIQETESLVDYWDCQSMDTVGYKEIIAFLRKKITKEEAISLIKQHSRNYAKRQTTWIKKFNPGLEVHDKTIEEILKFIQKE
ncbi:MAG: tRNA (adenosine(37)-N6)-dimethylallyltransferase MiaA [Bacteroidota bacterium]|nr:tRNA (adenosine(37)-N6)-dimethylallyltransferase MiaA [Bacteroidota bacterium]